LSVVTLAARSLAKRQPPNLPDDTEDPGCDVMAGRGPEGPRRIAALPRAVTKKHGGSATPTAVGVLAVLPREFGVRGVVPQSLTG
jgi:hypothetical protein